MDDDRTIRLLRAKVGELEAKVRAEADASYETTWLAADIALIAGLLADHIETRCIAPAPGEGVA